MDLSSPWELMPLTPTLPSTSTAADPCAEGFLHLVVRDLPLQPLPQRQLYFSPSIVDSENLHTPASEVEVGRKRTRAETEAGEDDTDTLDRFVRFAGLRAICEQEMEEREEREENDEEVVVPVKEKKEVPVAREDTILIATTDQCSNPPSSKPTTTVHTGNHHMVTPRVNIYINIERNIHCEHFHYYSRIIN